MQTRRIIQWAVAAMLAASALALTACSGSSSDKAGGADAVEPRVLTLASPIGDAPAPLLSWAEEVNRLSDGTLAVEFKEYWRGGEQLFEAGTLEDVKAGKVDMGWVGSRVFDTVGITSFQALVAPLLIDSHDLQGRVFEEKIPERMLEGVSELDLVGIGVLPGPMRKVLGVSKPFARPGDFQGEVVGFQDSGVGDADPAGARRHAPSYALGSGARRSRRLRATARLDRRKLLRHEREIPDPEPEPLAPPVCDRHG